MAVSFAHTGAARRAKAVAAGGTLQQHLFNVGPDDDTVYVLTRSIAHVWAKALR